MSRDVEALRNDLSNVRNDLAALLRFLRNRGRDVAATNRHEAQEWRANVQPEPVLATGVYVEERKPRPRVWNLRRSRASARMLVWLFAAGLITALLLTRKRERVVVEPRTERRRLVSRPWDRWARHRTAVGVKTAEPAVPQDSSAQALPLW